MKSLLGVLCLGLVLVHSRADHHHDCHKTLGSEELHQLDGDWVLVGSILDKSKGALEEMPNMTSSHLETRVQPDNHTLTVHERNVYSGKCVHYTFSLVLPQEPSTDGHHRLDLANAMVTKDGETKPYPDKGFAQFFHSDKDTMLMSYSSETYGNHFGMYKREGQHLDDMEKHHEELRAMAKCLNREGENFAEWVYDGADFCHKKSALPTLGSDELHQVHGDWVKVWWTYDMVKNHEEHSMTKSSFHMEFRVDPDNHTVHMYERKLFGEKCIYFKGNLVLPQHSEKIHRLNLEDPKVISDGVEILDNDTATAEFFVTSDNTVALFYKSKNYGTFLVYFRREGQHVDDLEKDHEKYRKKAKYLGLSGENFVEWHYKLADFCHKKSVLPTLGSDELYKVHGDWLLLLSTYDKVKNQEEHWVNNTRCHMEFRLHPDNHTVHMLERNFVGEKTYVYKGNLVLPQHSEKIHSLHLEDPKEIHDGVETPDNDTATVEFFETSENSLLLFYKSKNHGNFLLYYKKVGQDLDLKELVTEHEKYNERAKYLGLSGDNYERWEYKMPASHS